MYSIVFTKQAHQDWKKLGRDERRKIISKLEYYAKNPFSYARRLTEEKIGMYRFRVGDYRIICDIEAREMIILRIGHRKDMYR